MPSLLHAAVLETRNYIVGAANAPSGLYTRSPAGAWSHTGWRNVRSFGLTVDGTDPRTVYLAAGNGVLRSCDSGETWRVTTDWRVAEVLDVVVDPFVPDTIYAATAYGPWSSPDGGETWQPMGPPGTQPDTTFMPVLVPDAGCPGRLTAGTEDGLFTSADAGHTWLPVGPRGPVRALVQHPKRLEIWLAGTGGRGLLLSEDGGATWSTRGSETTVYAVACDPAEPERMAAAGFETGLLTSEDGGRTWTQRALDLPTRALHALAFDPDVSGRLWLGTVGEGVFITDDSGATCAEAGLPETTVYAFAFAAV